jgi:chromate transport protein ChrA
VILQILLTFSVLSLVAIGGANAVLPEMHRQLVELRGWMDDATFPSSTPWPRRRRGRTSSSPA